MNGGTVRVTQRALITTAVVVSVLLILVFVWFAMDLLMLLFLGVIISIPLRRISALVGHVSGWRHGISLAAVTLVLLAVVAGIGWLVAGRIADEAGELANQVQSAFNTVRAQLSGYAWFQRIVKGLPNIDELLRTRSNLLSNVTGVASTALGFVLSAVVVLVVGIYLASQPGLYSNGFKHLLPFGYRDRAGEILDVIDDALGRWIVGRLVLMVINGGLTAIALWGIGVPLALILGVVAGVLNFIPNFGPFIAAVPALLIAFVERPVLALYTGLIYIVVQTVDAYILTPLVDRKSVDLPPVITIAAQLMLGLISGFVGLLVASPLTATMVILIKMLYVEDVLGDPIMSGTSGTQPNTERAA